MKLHDVFVQAKATLSDESKWCKGSMARTREEKAVPCTHPDAIKWCILGAIYLHAEPGSVLSAQMQGYLSGRSAMTNDSLSRINDSRGHQAIMAELDKLIEETKDLEY